MPIDAGIYQGVRPVQSPLETMADVAKLRNAELANRIGEQRLQSEQLETQEKQRKERTRSMLNAALSHYVKPDGSLDRDGITKELVSSGFPDIAGAMGYLDEYDKARADVEGVKARTQHTQMEVQEAERKLAGSIGRGAQFIIDNGGSLEDATGLALTKIAAAPGLTDEERHQIAAGLDPSNPEQAQKTIRALIAADAPEPAKEQAGYTLNPGDVRFNAKNQEVARGLDKAVADKVPPVGGFEDYVLRTYGPNPTSAQVLAARKAYGQADDRPAVNVRLGNGMTPGQEFNATRQLRNDFNRETNAARTVATQLAQMKSSLDAVRKGASPAGSQGVLVTFQKILDPLSVVRESEYARSSAGLSLMGRIEGQWDKIKQGGAGVTVKDLEQFVALAEQFTKNQQAFAKQSADQINKIADRYGLDASTITRDVAAPAEDAGTVTTGGGTAKPKATKRFNPATGKVEDIK